MTLGSPAKRVVGASGAPGREVVRSFIAVAVPPEAAERLRAAQDRLRQAAPEVKWVRPDGFHITLKFLGGVDRERLGEVWQSVTRAIAGVGPFTMRFRGVGAFPNVRRARVLWAGITDGAAELTDLAGRVEGACAEHGFAREERPFQAHMTLGRVRSPTPNRDLEAAVAELESEDLGEAGVDRVLLMKSQLTPQGAIYTVLEQWPLG